MFYLIVICHIFVYYYKSNDCSAIFFVVNSFKIFPILLKFK
ncbi:hypothetical protein MCERE19_02716 [Spirosomataceae bacterium]